MPGDTIGILGSVLAASGTDSDNVDDTNARRLKDYVSANLTNVEVKDEHKVSVTNTGAVKHYNSSSELHPLPYCLPRHPVEQTLPSDGVCPGRDGVAGGVFCQPDNTGASLSIFCQETVRVGEVEKHCLYCHC